MHDLFAICSKHATFKLQRTRIQNTKVAVYISDTPVTLKQSQGHQAFNGNVDPMEGYSQAKFAGFCCNGVRERGQRFFFFSKQGNMLIISFEHV